MRKQRVPGRHRWRTGCREKIRHLRLRGAVEAYADGELFGAHRTRVAAHIAGCWACAGSLELTRLMKASLRGNPQRTPASLTSVRTRRFALRLIAPPGPER